MNVVSNRAYLGVALMTTAVLVVCLLLALVGLQNFAKAALPGQNGKIAFASNRDGSNFSDLHDERRRIKL